MRASAIERLSHGEIKLDEWAILTPAEKTKKRRRNYIEGLPENLWLWLERTPVSAFKLTSRQINKRREKAFIRAGLLVTAAMARKDKIAKKAPPKFRGAARRQDRARSEPDHSCATASRLTTSPCTVTPATLRS
jgi:hypothetical protein